MDLKDYTLLVVEKAESAMRAGNKDESIRLLRLLRDVITDKIVEIEKS